MFNFCCFPFATFFFWENCKSLFLLVSLKFIFVAFRNELMFKLKSLQIVMQMFDAVRVKNKFNMKQKFKFSKDLSINNFRKNNQFHNFSLICQFSSTSWNSIKVKEIEIFIMSHRWTIFFDKIFSSMWWDEMRNVWIKIYVSMHKQNDIDVCSFLACVHWNIETTIMSYFSRRHGDGFMHELLRFLFKLWESF